MTRATLLLAAALIVPAATVAAQDVAPDRFEGRLDAPTALAVGRIVDSAAAAGLPANPLVNKALEGASKRAAGERIVVAVRSLAADLGTSRRALGVSASEAELMAGVGALRAGAAPEVLQRVKAARGSASALLPLAVLTDLVAQGVPVDRAVTRVVEVAERHGDDAQFRALPGERGRSAGKSENAGRGTSPAVAESPPRAEPPGQADRPPRTEDTPAQGATPPRGRPASPGKGRPSGRP